MKKSFLFFLISFSLVLNLSVINGYTFWNTDVKKAKEFIELGMYPQAMEVLNKRINETPSDDEAHYVLGICLLQLERFSEADQSFRRAVHLKSSWGYKIGDEYMKVGSSSLNKGNFNQAKMIYYNATQYNPKLQSSISENCFKLGQNFLSQNRYQITDNCFAIAASIDESYKLKSSKEFLEYGKKLLNDRNFKDSQAVFNLALKYDPSLTKDAYNIISDYANNALKNNQNDIADAAFLIAKSIDPSSADQILSDQLKQINFSKNILEKEIMTFYSTKSEWAGVFEIEYIEKLRLVNRQSDLKEVHAKYKFKAIPGNQKNRTDAGFDQRIFILKKVENNFQIVNMQGHMSASF